MTARQDRRRYPLDLSDPSRNFYTVEQEPDGSWKWYWTGSDWDEIDSPYGSWPTRVEALRAAAADAEETINAAFVQRLAHRLRLAARITEKRAEG